MHYRSKEHDCNVIMYKFALKRTELYCCALVPQPRNVLYSTAVL